ASDTERPSQLNQLQTRLFGDDQQGGELLRSGAVGAECIHQALGGAGFGATNGKQEKLRQSLRRRRGRGLGGGGGEALGGCATVLGLGCHLESCRCMKA